MEIMSHMEERMVQVVPVVVEGQHGFVILQVPAEE
jgi:hypothetical protein